MAGGRHRTLPVDAPGLTRVERLRRLQGLTLKEMVPLTQVSHSMLGRVMLGHFPEVRVAIRIARFFHLSVEDLWGNSV